MSLNSLVPNWVGSFFLSPPRLSRQMLAHFFKLSSMLPVALGVLEVMRLDLVQSSTFRLG